MAAGGNRRNALHLGGTTLIERVVTTFGGISRPSSWLTNDRDPDPGVACG